jgi:DNA-directed RNA polymerase
MSYEGGYYLIKESLLRTGIHQHSSVLDRPFSDITLQAVNSIQATPWRINDWVLDLLRECYTNRVLVGDVPDSDDKPIPTKMADDVWARIDDKAKAEYKKQRSELHAERARAESSRISFLSKIGIAEELRHEDAIYFPHFLDFRGRVYPIAADLHPQGDDVSKSLLHFARGKRLGHGGIKWLAIRIANSAGHDKDLIDARIKWVWDNTAMIRACATDPLGNTALWSKLEEPWQFLAGCREWAMSLDWIGGQENFISHLPVNVDGTANGLQHLSALGRDPVGAKATNMTSDPHRQDIYEEVAKDLRRRIADSAAAGVIEAIWWVGKVTRSTVKRAVMTTPYGVTDRGIRDQLVSDGHVNDAARKDRGKYADFLKDRMVESLGATVTAAKEIMAYIQKVTEVLTEAGHPLRWVTPSGNVVQQTYHRLARRKIETLTGAIILWDEDPRAGYDVRKNCLASAPNVIHSLDASALTLTVAKLIDRDISWAMIHDSYGCHAADMEMLSQTLREVFVEMYSGDWLADFEAYILSYAPEVELPPRPERGTFDVREVLDAQYFFA